MLSNSLLSTNGSGGAYGNLVEKLFVHTITEWFVEIKKFIHKKPCWIKADACLKLVSGHEKLAIPACVGNRTLSEVRGEFNTNTGLPSTSGRYRVDDSSKPIGETAVEVYELTEAATLARLFTSLSFDLDSLVLTEEQILVFSEKYLNWLRFDVMTTLFLFKNNGNFFVANVYTSTDNSHLRVDLYPLDTCIRFGSHPKRRLVVAKNIRNIQA